jgi:hypothetical protein
MSAVEWVFEAYSLPADEPQLFEAVAADSAANIAEVGDDEARDIECVYYGDAEIDETLVDPVSAFEVFAGHIFSARAQSELVREDGERHQQDYRPKSINAKAGKPKHSLVPASKILESRQERLSRICREINELSVERDASIVLRDGNGQDERAEPMLVQLDSIREALQRLSDLSRFKVGTTGSRILMKSRPMMSTGKSPDLEIHENGQTAPTYIELYSKDAGTLADLDLRVRALERDLIPDPDVLGSSTAWEMLRCVQAQLDSADTAALEDMRASIEQIATAIDGDENLARIADAADLLRKLDQLSEHSSAIPALAARLRSIKTVVEDAAGVNLAVADLSARCDKLLAARQENRDVLSQLTVTLGQNMETMHANMNALQKRLEALLI